MFAEVIAVLLADRIAYCSVVTRIKRIAPSIMLTTVEVIVEANGTVLVEGIPETEGIFMTPSILSIQARKPCTFSFPEWAQKLVQAAIAPGSASAPDTCSYRLPAFGNHCMHDFLEVP